MRLAKECAKLRVMTREAARRVLLEVYKEYPFEKLYAVCLYTYDDLTGPVLAAASKAAFEFGEHHLRNSEKHIKLCQEYGMNFENTIMDLKWSPFEWDPPSFLTDEFAAVCEYVNELQVAERSFGNNLTELFAAMLAAYAGALQDLDREGLFGDSRSRDAITLFCTIADSWNASWYNSATSRLLNSPEVYMRHEQEYLSWNSEDESLQIPQNREYFKTIQSFFRHYFE